ncbi:SLAM family member 8 isoform X2 [Thamnophis elegans]|uniref:SLAM family member 8 isoform X2 n=1 Tax=Thamnophis elegans TaxID=35005 RepID=UPI001378D2FA|nr:SLAM family member 8 isoform X2 [Thamnophis elegans]
MGWVALAWMIASAVRMSRAYTPTAVLGVAGSSVLFKAAPPPNFHVREFIWRSQTPLEELVATSFKGRTEIQYRSRFYGRTRLHDNFTLEINPVDLEDAGILSVLLVDTGGQMKQQAFRLKVYDTISTPVIRVFPEEKAVNGSSESCLLFLSCHAASRTNVTYEWAGLGGKHWMMEEGQLLRIKLDPKESPQASYTCTASNPMVLKSATVELRDSCQRPSGKKMFYTVPGNESIQL